MKTLLGLLLPKIVMLGIWHSGAGYSIQHSGLNGGTAVDDPGQIDLGERGIWSGIKQGLKYATALFGNTDRIQSIKVQVPGDMSVTVGTAGTALSSVTVTGPSGATAAALGKVVGVVGPNLQANSVDGNVQVVTIQLGNNADGTVATIAGIY